MAGLGPAYVGEVTSAGIPDPYVPPSGSWGVTGNIAASGDVQGGTLTSDAGLALSGAITGATTVTATGVITTGDGTEGAPTYAFTNATTAAGMYLFNSNTLGWSTQGILRMYLTSASLVVVGAIKAGLADQDIGSDNFPWRDGFFDQTVFVHSDAAGEVSTDLVRAIEVPNITDADDGAQQYSGNIVQRGQGWRTAATAETQPCKWQTQVIPIQGAANPTSEYHWFSEINDAGYVSRMKLTSAGLLSYDSARKGMMRVNANGTAQTINSTNEKHGIVTERGNRACQV